MRDTLEAQQQAHLLLFGGMEQVLRLLTQQGGRNRLGLRVFFQSFTHKENKHAYP
jgi:hypothetical protein